ncbi:MAG: response regulator, partial [Chloroflexota bacterium]
MAETQILIVDDEIDVLDLCERILAAKGYNVKTAHNGQQAIELAQRERFDLLLTDIKMPGMSGLEIAQALKESDPNTICITMTGYSTMDMVIEALKLGIDEFILKPFTPDELARTVFEALEKESLRKENVRLRSLIPLFELNKTLMGTVEVSQVLQSLLNIAQEETKADFACLYAKEEESTQTYKQYGGQPPVDTPLYDLCQTLLKQAVSQEQQIILNSKQFDSPLSDSEIAAIIATPLPSKTSNLGVLILARKTYEFTPSDEDFLAILSGQASIALENAQLFAEKQAAYEALKQLDHMKSEFINIAAHELRTPLTLLVGYLTILEEEVSQANQIYVASLMRNALRLRTLLDDLLSLNYL